MKWAGLILAVVLLVGGWWLFAQYQKAEAIEQLSVSIERVRLIGSTLSFVDLEMYINVSNPNAVDVTVGALNGSLFANNVQLTNVSISTFSVKKKSSSLQPIEARIRYSDVGSAVMVAVLKGEVQWRIEGTYQVDVFGFSYPFDFTIEREWSP